MSNFELIDDYLTNRLAEQEKVTFEQQLGSDPALKADVDLQKHILEGVKKARVAELKAMLNNVPVGGGFSAGLTAGKIAAAVVAAGILGTSIYLYLRPGETNKETPSAIVENKVAPGTAGKEAEIKPSESPQPAKEQPVKIEPKKERANSFRKKGPSKAAATPKPKIEVIDPSDELVENSTKEVSAAENQKSAITTSHIAVELNSTNRKYNFHYQFAGGKLILYGAFDKSLYEILEIHGDHPAVFLFFKENYYLLNEQQNKITSLQPIRDGALLRKLKEYRGR